jgi:hypothetical protein
MITRRPRRSIAAVALVTLALLAVPRLVLGHAELDTISPADKSSGPSPAEIVATFTENLTPTASSFTVVDATGAVVAKGGTVDDSDQKTMRLELQPLPAGTYTIRWTSKSAQDGDIARGTTTFTVAAASPSPTAPPTTAPSEAASPSPARSASASASPAPSPSGGTGTPTSSGDVLIPIVVALIALALLGLWLLRGRGRRAA